MFIIDCQKNLHNGLWCFDYEFSSDLSVESEPLMHQASALADEILQKTLSYVPEKMSITFDQEPMFDEQDATLVYDRSEYGGSIYTVSELLGETQEDKREIWLCPVLTYFFTAPPETLYVWVNEFSVLPIK